MEIITVSKKTVEEAITEACIQLGLASTDVEVEVIEKGSAGFLGIGAKQAVIKAWKKQEKKENKKEVKKEAKKVVEEPKKEEVKEEAIPVVEESNEEVAETEEKLAEVEPQTKEACEKLNLNENQLKNSNLKIYSYIDSVIKKDTKSQVKIITILLKYQYFTLFTIKIVCFLYCIFI